jgi:hypothetical protein
MIAKYPGKRPCIHCAGSILAGQKIAGEKGSYFHEDCSDLTIYSPNASNGNGKPEMKDPSLPMSLGQMSLIGDLLTERVVTMGEAHIIIEHLKSRPKKSPAEELAGRLAA